ncbi:hypothetical protein DFA_06646 [Cavenderia fasciculata]|uniref:Iron-binding zinc finger CDGSH type domain-containing protein n=1 Tax=Cavenderia fasciculata TaxID=261658 RepID=F4Q1W0_CACFS|nr:uncharacterized protein DFA_06646 [Cavenderia fasciculata]EGG17980.1 hypothetical protein DFA_06646 [Cavenderia fasciculata]|eukprot:XP_004356872.1 hypothetical protein DFA_06646 [Cavenderia fasciculata]
MNSAKDIFESWTKSTDKEEDVEEEDLSIVPSLQWEIAQHNYSLDGPIPVDASNEDKWICRCGQSKSYPYCDGSHTQYNIDNGSNVGPLKVPKENGRIVYVCRCGYSKEKPFCDGTHTKLRLIDRKPDDTSLFTSYLIIGASFLIFSYLSFKESIPH